MKGARYPYKNYSWLDLAGMESVSLKVITTRIREMTIDKRYFLCVLKDARDGLYRRCPDIENLAVPHIKRGFGAI